MGFETWGHRSGKLELWMALLVYNLVMLHILL